MQPGQHWEAAALGAALKDTQEAKDGKITVEVGTEIGPEAPADAIHVRLHSCGDLDVFVGVNKPVILASTVLCKADEVPRREEFERGLLRANKAMILSAFALTSIGGVEHYEVYGELSTGSEIEEIVEEIETLGRNAIQAAEMLHAWTTGKEAA